MSNLSIWLTPIWLLSVGVAAGLLVLLLFWGILAVFSRPAARAIGHMLGEGVLQPLSYIFAGVATFALLASVTMPVGDVVESLARLPEVRPIEEVISLPAGAEDVALSAPFETSELYAYRFASQQDIAVNVEPGIGFTRPLILVEGGDPYAWTPGGTLARSFEGPVDTLYFSNESDQDATIEVLVLRDVEMPQVREILVTAAVVVGLYLLYFVLRWSAPKLSIIAASTSQETISQPIFLLLTIVGAVALVAFVFIPYNTFGEDVKMLTTSGMTLIKVLAIVVALWTASVSVADEIEGRTALTVLSKPVGRRQFILGKFVGIVWPIVLMFVILGGVFLICVSFKVVYDAREASKTTPLWQLCNEEVVRVVPGLVLAFFESVIMAAISVAVSTRLSMLPNLVICGSVYVLGHLAALMVKSSAGEIVFVKFIGQLLAVLLPVLDHFEIEGAIAGSSTAPPEYLLAALVYSLLYCTAAMLLALTFFEDRDLA